MDARQADGNAKHHRRNQQEAGERVGGDAQAGRMPPFGNAHLGFGIHLHKRSHHIKQHISRRHNERALQNRFPVFGNHFFHRRVLRFAFGFRFAVNMAFMQGHPHPQAHNHQHKRQHERNAPAPLHQFVMPHQRADGEERAVCHKQANWRAQLRERAEPCAFAFGRVFGGNQSRAAPFAAQAQTLPDAANTQ